MPNDNHDDRGRFTFSEGSSGTNTGNPDHIGSSIQKAASDLDSIKEAKTPGTPAHEKIKKSIAKVAVRAINSGNHNINKVINEFAGEYNMSHGEALKYLGEVEIEIQKSK